MSDSILPSWRRIGDHLGPVADRVKSSKPTYTASAVLADGSIAEMVCQPAEAKTAFCVFKDGVWKEEAELQARGQRLVPFSGQNNLVRNEIVLLPSEPAEYGTEAELVAGIQSFIHRYLHVSAVYERLAAYYVLFSWVSDGFNELPYLRVRGDYGSGKTRFLLTIGSLCYKPIFASGASTVSPIFRILDAFGGTLIIDEGDFRFSDEKAEIVKILNNGNVRGFPVLRSEVNKAGEYNPHAYTVFGPKIVATRGPFQDKALESRCLTEELGNEKLRSDIPINLPPSFKEEALRLRNQLLLFRFRNFAAERAPAQFVDPQIEPRLNQIFAPLLSIIGEEAARMEIRSLARSFSRELASDRGMDAEAQVLEILRSMTEAGETRLVVKEIAQWFIDRFGEDYDRKVTPRWIGYLIRHRLQLKTRKSDGVFVVPPEELPKLTRLWERFGIGNRAASEDEFAAIPTEPSGDLREPEGLQGHEGLRLGSGERERFDSSAA